MYLIWYVNLLIKLYFFHLITYFLFLFFYLLTYIVCNNKNVILIVLLNLYNCNYVFIYYPKSLLLKHVYTQGGIVVGVFGWFPFSLP